ncbi:MAG: glycosyltransferase family 2 protein [Nanoarchaeota archaeon]|nr:glycosyltransferase family 2 protein [Nanoarchaeota archaeon]
MEYSIIIPAYNEEEGLEKTFKRVFGANPGAEIILVDDGSKDKTWSIMQRLAKNKKTIALRHENNKGKANALKTGYDKAKNEILATIDSDCTYPPEEIPKLVKKIEEGYDMAVGSRFTKGFPKGYSWKRAIANILGAFFTSIILMHKVTDVTTGLRAFNKKVTKLPSKAKNLDYEAELTARVIRDKLKYVEVAIKTEQRFGMSKLHFFKSCWTFFIAVLRGRFA